MIIIINIIIIFSCMEPYVDKQKQFCRKQIPFYSKIYITKQGVLGIIALPIMSYMMFWSFLYCDFTNIFEVIAFLEQSESMSLLNE